MPNQSQSYEVPQNVRAAAKRGLELRQKYGRGGLDPKQAHEAGVGSGVTRASDLVSGSVTYATIKRMIGFFSRHKKNKDSRLDNGEPGAGMIAWLLWGGDPGFAWAKRIVEQEEGVKKGTLFYSVLFGDDDLEEREQPDDAEIKKAAPVFSFLEAVQKKKAELIEVAEDYTYEGEVTPLAPPADAIAPEQEPLSDKQIEQIAQATDDQAAEAVMQKGLKHPSDAPTEPPPAPEPEPEYKINYDDLLDAALEEDPTPPHTHLVLSAEEQSQLRKSIKAVRNIPKLDPAAKKIASQLMRGEFRKIDGSKLLSFLQDPDSFEGRACGGRLMLALIEKASVPARYVEGSKDPAKRRKFIENRQEGKHEGDPYKPFPGDKEAKTKPSQYSKTAIAEKVREEAKDGSKSEFLRAAAKVSGVSRAILEQVYDRGMEAWATGGHRPGATQEAWARARIYSFLSGGKTQKTADKDLWDKHKEGVSKSIPLETAQLPENTSKSEVDLVDTPDMELLIFSY